MSKTTEKYNKSLGEIEQFLNDIPYKYHFKVDTIANISRVPIGWHIEKYRKNLNQHLLFVKGGQGYYDLDGKLEKLERGKIIFVSNGFPHSAYPEMNDCPAIIPIRFSIMDNKTRKPIDNFFQESLCIVLKSSNILRYESCFRELNSAFYNQDQRFAKQICNHLLTEIFLMIIKEKVGTPKVDMRLELVKNMIDEHPDKSYLMSDLAQEANLSVSQFTSIFKKYFGMTPHQYHINVKINYADYLLKETTMSIKEIAYNLGYPNQYAFSKQYKKIFGISPINNRRV